MFRISDRVASVHGKCMDQQPVYVFPMSRTWRSFHRRSRLDFIFEEQTTGSRCCQTSEKEPGWDHGAAQVGFHPEVHLGTKPAFHQPGPPTIPIRSWLGIWSLNSKLHLGTTTLQWCRCYKIRFKYWFARDKNPCEFMWCVIVLYWW